MGVVYRGEHPGGKKPPVAIKAIHGQLQTNPQVVARFFAESVVLARVVHQNVVRFRDFGYDAQGSAYLVMELLDGETLANRLARERRLDISTATDIAMQIGYALVAAHEQGVIHRDIKPENVFLCRSGTVKLLDFGVAKIEGQGPTQTLQGDLLGTAAYMAPEQGRSASESDARSDLYSVGCILFEMVCGVVPFPGSLVETLVAHQTAQRPPARALNAEVSHELDAIIDRLLARDPAARPQSASDVVRALARLESTAVRPRTRPPRSGTVVVRRALSRVRGTRMTRAYALLMLGALATGVLLAQILVR
jgi:serine/threonine-protein kinase